jgi:hypothetical protein
MPNEIELTEEMIADAKCCSNHKCTQCRLNAVLNGGTYDCVALVQWFNVKRKSERCEKWYTRAPPKSPARLRAESIIGAQLDGEEREKAITALEGALG